MDKTELLLKEPTESDGVAGYEGETRSVIKKHFELLGEILGDKLGSLICRNKGRAQEPKVVLAGHMDEIGFMVKLITAEKNDRMRSRPVAPSTT